MKTLNDTVARTYVGGIRIAMAVPAIAGVLLGSAPLSAQSNTGGVTPITSIMSPDGVSHQLPSRPRGFNLFAEEDLAAGTLRPTGVFRSAIFNGGGVCTFGATGGDLFVVPCATYPNVTYFHFQVSWGVGLADYRNIRDVHPGIAGMVPPVGYSTPWRITSLDPKITRIGPADGQFGQYFSGAVTQNGQGCRDVSGFAGSGVPENVTMMAHQDCPETWANGKFDGIKKVDQDMWKRQFDRDPAAFRWDDWKIPANELAAAPFLGENSIYGAFSDFPREVVARYGAVTPRGSGPPTDRGFPLGLEVRMDHWKFDRPSLRDGMVVRWLVINRSEKVWGTGIDYDAIYMGIDPASQSPAQYPAVHSIMSMGVQQSLLRGFSNQCSATFPKRVPPGATTACAGTSTSNAPFIVFLKSPLGDLRNKLFSDPTSKFYNPTSTEADDTLTFNHYLRGGFNGQDQLSFRRSDRATFGGMAGDETLWLDGRVAGDFTAGNVWTYFMYEGTTGTNDAANLRYNKSVPSSIPGYGKWDYNDDGIPDTIRVPDCGQFGCVQPWYDTQAGGFSNNNGANVQNFIGAGPFALKAGDTTSFIFYITSVAKDTLIYKTRYNNIIKAYFNSWEGANAYPTPTITPANIQISSAWLRDSTGGDQDTQIRIQLNMPPKSDDAYIKSVLDRVNSNEPIAVTLRNLNPTLVATLTERWHQNLAQVLMFKSCDRGVSWTSATQCTAATSTYQTRDEAGNPVGIGWRYRTLINVDPITGALSSNSITETVESGHDYLYSFVTKTRALKDVQVVLSETVNAAGVVTARTMGTLQDALNIDIDSIVSPLKSSGPSTALVYAPLSVPAGTIYARLDTTRTQGVNTARVQTTARASAIQGDFRMRFGNQFVIRRTVNSATGGATSTIIRRSVYANARRSDTDPVQINFIASADTFTSNTTFTYGSPTASALTTVPDSVVGTTTYYSQTVSTPGYVVADGTPGVKPYFVAIGTSYTNFTQSTAEFEAAAHYPGFTATINSETAPPAARTARVLRGVADTLNDGVTTSNAVVYTSAGSVLYGPGGYYRITWAGDAFGPKGGDFRWGTYEQMKPVWDASLAARATVSTTVVDEAFRLLANFPGGAAGTRPMVAAKLPFTMTGSGGKEVRIVMLQRYNTGNVADSLLKNSRVLGTTGDTTRLMIPVDMWMPGDTLYVLEKIMTDSTVLVGTTVVSVVRDTTIGGRMQTLPIQVEREVLGLRMLLACASGFQPARNTCNPLAIGTRGTGSRVPFQAGGYLPFANGYVSVTHLNRVFDQNSEFKLVAQPFQASARPLTKSDMDRVFVVPNPYIVQSGFDAVASNRQIASSLVRFVNVPAQGTLRIYSISGQLMQQLTWTQADLIIPATVGLTDSTRAVMHGDLPYNLRTREGLDLGPGLYLYVLTPGGSLANGQSARGKFVVIR